jgi:hypothetical protein
MTSLSLAGYARTDLPQASAADMAFKAEKAFSIMRSKSAEQFYGLEAISGKRDVTGSGLAAVPSGQRTPRNERLC